MKPILEADISPFKIVADLIDGHDGKTAKMASKFFRGSKDPKIYLGGSISNYASDLIMTFPMLVDNSLGADLCSMISKANERNIVSMLHLLFSSASFQGTDGKEIIKSIYGKVNTNLSMDDYIDQVNSFVTNYRENYHIGYISKDREMNRLINETVKAINECVKEGKIMMPAFENTTINETALTDYTVMRDYNDKMVVQEATPHRANKFYTHKMQQAGQQQQANAPFGYSFTVNPDTGDEEYVKHDLSKNRLGMIVQDPNGGLDDTGIRNYNDVTFKTKQLAMQAAKQGQENRYRMGQMRQAEFDRKNDYVNGIDVINRRLLDSDVKKANELQPTLMVVNYSQLDGDGTIYDKKAFVCGVKSRLIAVEPNDIIDRIVSKNKTRLSFLNFIRATTGEIKMLKDFILSLDQAKIDAKNSVKKGEAAQIWKTLESLSNRNNLNKMRRNGNDASAITTLVINKETSNLIKKQFRIDIEQPRVAKQILDMYNLLGIFIVDESVEIVKVLYRGYNMYEQQAFSYLEKEDNDKSYKKVINLIGQMNR